MYSLIQEVLYILLKPFGKAFSDRQFKAGLLVKHVILQKVFRINGHVLWPVDSTSKVIAPEKIERGTRCPGLSKGCHIDGRNGIQFGRNVWIGPDVKIVSMNHDVNDYTQYLESSPIKIGDNCWIGAGAVILPGVELGNHVVVGAGAVVTKSFDDNEVIAGNPARTIRKLEAYKSE